MQTVFDKFVWKECYTYTPHLVTHFIQSFYNYHSRMWEE